MLADHRDEVTLATKMGINGIAPEGGIRFATAPPPTTCAAAARSRWSGSATDHIDLYYLHRVDPETPIEDTIGAMGDLVQAGKVRYVGVSEVTAEQLAARPRDTPDHRRAERVVAVDPRPRGRGGPGRPRLGVGLVPFSPLGRGFLTGALAGKSFEGQDSRARMPRFSDDNLAANEAIVAVVVEVAEARGVRPGQVALAWVHSRGEDVVPIPGTKRVEYLEQNVAALDVRLTEDELARLDGLAAQVAGARY